jgi:hypothetical protein
MLHEQQSGIFINAEEKQQESYQDQGRFDHGHCPATLSFSWHISHAISPAATGGSGSSYCSGITFETVTGKFFIEYQSDVAVNVLVCKKGEVTTHLMLLTGMDTLI